MNEGGNSCRVLSGGRKDSANEKNSDKSDSEEDSDDRSTSHEHDDESDDQSPPVQKSTGKQKEVVVEGGGFQLIQKGQDNLRSGKNPRYVTLVFEFCLCEV